ncbi:hypothetical protein A2837_01715 [Candidatus Kaiserbacteria bacterium RIFCSPHIGHO2_01_FULL_46_22]|uniref:DNA 3'-5' helicase n=1 Tax=Candidatus Kaiserbacteria bacterium RIFCSPHIGHO2_01_FULL_46_22 TaxID=1798475 RepID=A0A1F6BZG7_9BACT|nr:MAG: hypothetical protein A2837_01715 [Candidatus Kaiserbacteria bacterium RIFCSPHIGHO2_01_FULL_46_22]
MKEAKADRSTFEEAYAKLNSHQKAAVDTIDGPVMVIAGPGTGKTEILALRIANILLRTDTRPENILALTFTDAGAHNMRNRLARYIGADSYHVAVHTFHSFAGEQIGRYPDAYPSIIGGRAASDIEKLQIIEEIINDNDFKLLRPHGDPLYYVREIPRAISDLKKEYVTPEIFAERITEEETLLASLPKLHEKGAHKGKVRKDYLEFEKRVSKHRELLRVYQLYQATLRDRRLYDFEDMIVETVKALEGNEDMLRDLQETYQYILADEHQDVNESQNRILEILADFHDRPNIFVVGDEKQAIFRFQGASLNNFLYFQDRFPGTKVIALTDNYRSTSKILDLSYELIKTDDEILRDLRVPLNAAGAASSETGRVEHRNFPHEAIEDEWVIEEVKAALASGTAPDDIVIITRYNRDVLHFTNRLRQSGIEASPSADIDILEHPITLSVETLIRAASLINDEKALFDCLLCGCWRLEAGDLARVFAARSTEWPLARLIADANKLGELGIENPSPILKVGELLSEARLESATKPPHQVLHFLIKESGFLDHIMQTDPIEGASVLRRVYDEIETAVISQQATTLREVATQFQYRRLHNLPITAPFVISNKGSVQVMTVHKSKGLEFDTVILPRVTDKCFGKSSKRDLFKLPLTQNRSQLGENDEEDDERRLLYVAMTRAKTSLLVSAGEMNGEGKPLDLSRFLPSIGLEYLKTVDVAAQVVDFEPAKIFASKSTSFQLTPEIIKALFLARGFSVTHLNNYLEDPQKYFYDNLLRRPQPRAVSLLFGTTVHEVLDQAALHISKNGVLPSDTLISDWLKGALRKLPLSVSEDTSLHERAYSALLAYLPTLARNVGEKSRSEFSVSTILKTDDPDLPEIPLTGKLDRVDFDEAGNITRVADYKTGKAKSRNDVAGETKSSDGKYKRQLVFYGLLLSLSNPDRPLPAEFTISFVEPKESGDIVEHTFTVTRDEIEELKGEVIRVAKEIISGEKF